MDRKKVTFLVILDQEGPSENELEFIQNYNARFSAERGFFDKLLNAPFLVRYFWREVIETYGLVLFRRWQFLTYIIGVIVYVLSPFDLIPEAVFGLIGLIDDIMFVILALIGIGTTFFTVLQGRNE